MGHLSLFQHKGLDIWTLVHGDDYCSAGPADSLAQMQDMLEKRYEIKTQRIGVGVDRKGVQK